jgi:hypothetical protein
MIWFVKQSVTYIAEHVVGTGSFGVVYQVKLLTFSIFWTVLCLVWLISRSILLFSPTFRQNVEKLEKLLP